MNDAESAARTLASLPFAQLILVHTELAKIIGIEEARFVMTRMAAEPHKQITISVAVGTGAANKIDTIRMMRKYDPQLGLRTAIESYEGLHFVIRVPEPIAERVRNELTSYGHTAFIDQGA